MPVCQEKRPKILVIGSINMDMVARIDHIPLPGETVLGQGYSFAPGGKGANAAVAAARLGGCVAFAGCVGDDSYGQALRKTLTDEDVAGSIANAESYLGLMAKGMADPANQK